MKVFECHFTLEELEFLNNCMVRERVLTEWAQDRIHGLEFLGVKLTDLERPDITGKLLAYIKKARAEQ